MKHFELNYFSYSLFSGISSDIFRVLFFWWMISEYGGESLSTLLTITIIISFILLQILAPLADLKSKKKILILSSILFSGSFFFMATFSTFNDMAIYIGAIAFLSVSVVATLSKPAQNAIMPEITSNNRVSLLIQRNKVITSLIAILGPLLAGYLGTLSLTYGFILAGLLMLMSILVAYTLPDQKGEPHKKGTEDWLQAILAGWRVKKRATVEFWFTCATAVTNTLVTPFFMILIPLTIKNKFSASAFSYGLAESAVAVGSLFAAAILLPFLNKKLKKVWICSVGVFLAGVGITVSSLSENLAIFNLSVPIVGAGIAVFSMNGMSHRLLAFPKAMRSRMTAIDLSISKLTRVLGLSMTGLLITFFDADTVGLMYGACIMVLSFTLFMIPDWREFMSLNHDQLEGYFQRKYSL